MITAHDWFTLTLLAIQASTKAKTAKDREYFLTLSRKAGREHKITTARDLRARKARR